MKSIKNDYISEVRKRPRSDDGEEFASLPTKKRGRKLLLGEDLDSKVQLYLKKVRESGGAVSARIAMAAARGIVLKCQPSMLVENGGPFEATKYWAHSLLKRMKHVQRKSTTAKSKYTVANFAQKRKEFLQDIYDIVAMEEIPPELVLNWDQTGIKLVPSSSWTMERQGKKRVEMVGVNDKRQITALFCGTMLGDFLPVQLIYKGKTSRCHPKFSFPKDWHITHSPKHWSTESTMLDYINNVILPYIAKVRDNVGEDKAALVVMDNFKGQVTDSVMKLLEDNNMLVCMLPPNTTDRLQPLDISVNKPAKDYLKAQFNEWYTTKVMKHLDGKEVENFEEIELEPINLSMPVMKEVSAKWFVDMASYISDNPHIIVNGFISSGITDTFGGKIDDIPIVDANEDIVSTDSGNESSQEELSGDEQ